MTRATTLLWAGAALLTALPATAQPVRPEPAAPQYREGQAPVMTPRPKADPNAGNNASAADFRQWNASNGRPTILIFWTRSLTDDAVSGFEDYFGEIVANLPSGMATAQVAGSRPTESGRDQRINRELSEALQGSFMTTFLDNGAQILDRNALIRKVSLNRSREDRSDKQYLETLALEQGVKYLIEIVPDRKLNSPTKLTFLIKITHLPTSTVKAQFASDATPPSGSSRIVAGSYGFERRTDSNITVETIGSQIAYDVMRKIR